jgi:protein-disulfide isomerase
MRALLAGVAAAAALAGASALPAAQAGKTAPAAARDWSRTVTMTPEGGYRMGNPNAPVKLVEYGSLTCPHCADFSTGAKGKLEAHVRSGKVSFEFRNFVLNGVDAAAALLSRCAGPSGFFRLTESFYATQPQWLGKMSGLTQAQKDAIGAAPEAQRLKRAADAAGLTPLAVKWGLPLARANACLADRAALERLAKMYEAGAQAGVNHTPSFFINGQEVHAHDWAELQPLIRKAGG